jgi:hypothetical protein
VSEVFPITSERKDSRKSLAVVKFLTAYADLWKEQAQKDKLSSYKQYSCREKTSLA